MAQEIGHVLLGESSHSAEGLMSAAWKPWDGRVQTFTPSQVQDIIRRFTASVRQTAPLLREGIGTDRS